MRWKIIGLILIVKNKTRVDYMTIFENRRTNYQFIALLIYLKNILFSTQLQLQEYYEPSSINKIIMYKRKNRKFSHYLALIRD